MPCVKIVEIYAKRWAGSALASTRYITRLAGPFKKRPAVGFAVIVPVLLFAPATTVGGTGRVQPRLVRKNRDHPVTASSDILGSGAAC